jgi:DNA-binding MarR family transcriptional regulator
LIATLSKRAVARFEARMAEHGSSVGIWSILRQLVETGPISQRELADLLVVKGPSLVPRIDALEAAGLARRVPDSTDRRIQRVTLTPEGATLYRELAAVSDANEEELVSALSAEDAATFRRLAARLLVHLQHLDDAEAAGPPEN